MSRVDVRLYNPSIILIPITEQEAKQYSSSFASIYLLYKDINGEIQIGIPDMQRYSPFVANMWNITKEAEKAFFYNGGSNLSQCATSIEDRPVYEIIPTDVRTVGEVSILNGIDVELNEILAGNYVPRKKSEKEI